MKFQSGIHKLLVANYLMNPQYWKTEGSPSAGRPSRVRVLRGASGSWPIFNETLWTVWFISLSWLSYRTKGHTGGLIYWDRFAPKTLIDIFSVLPYSSYLKNKNLTVISLSAKRSTQHSFGNSFEQYEFELDHFVSHEWARTGRISTLAKCKYSGRVLTLRREGSDDCH